MAGLDEIAVAGERPRSRITTAVNARRRALAGIEARHGAIPGIRIADKTLEGVIEIRMAAAVVTCHSPAPAAAPGAQLILFEAEDGWRYSLWVTNLPSRAYGWRGQLAYIDAGHRAHSRVEDRVRTGKR